MLNNNKKFKTYLGGLIVLIIAIVGAILLINSHAATPYGSLEANSGTLSGNSSTQSCSGAVDGNCVIFNTGGGDGGSAVAPIASMDQNQGQENYIGNSAVYKYVILQDSMASAYPNLIPEIHAANPNTQVLMYADGAFIYVPPNGQCPDSYGINISAPVDTCDVSSQGNSSWYLTGSPVGVQGYSYYDWGNIGSTSYANQWVTNASSTAKKLGFDGIFMDDTNTNIGHGLSSIGGYNDDTYGAAMVTFFNEVAAGLHNNGLIVVPNVSDDAYGTQEQYTEEIAKNADAVFQEFFMNWGSGITLFSGTQWQDYLQEEINVGNISNFYGNTYDSNAVNFSNPAAQDIQVMEYGRASFLLGWNGKAGSAYQYHDDNDNNEDSVNMFNSIWTASVGSPSGSYSVQSNGLYQRSFTNGLVIVNPTTSTLSENLGATYTDTENNTQVNSVSLPATSAIILSNN